jgi:hypothetical protein
MSIYRLTPSRWPEAASDTTDVDSLVAYVLESAPPHVVVSEFDQDTAALIANRLVARGVEHVHVEGSGVHLWPTPQSICNDLIERLRAAAWRG